MLLVSSTFRASITQIDFQGTEPGVTAYDIRERELFVFDTRSRVNVIMTILRIHEYATAISLRDTSRTLWCTCGKSGEQKGDHPCAEKYTAKRTVRFPLTAAGGATKQTSVSIHDQVLHLSRAGGSRLRTTFPIAAAAVCDLYIHAKFPARGSIWFGPLLPGPRFPFFFRCWKCAVG
ncbi:hypothetical protein M011DRAFT_290377 [Sporormia fimetaria CBS 119925]|uniref:Uncharacterized protein n=1 Tax=Sporormia fimetaria CBS 119925 TaxID=1340428 RepID=A0A6A6UY48_9PLEO|nr:hypothetical protein M011DRAFT_290377 [Sporormia fimetaria CBS 119925]